MSPESGAWDDAAKAACLFAIDPTGTGVWLRALNGPVRDLWIELLRGALPAGAPLRRVPLNVTDDRLLGGLDLGATLHAGRPVAQAGILAEANGGVVVLAMAERLSSQAAARLASVLDRGEVALERDGLANRAPAEIGMVALDEGMADDESPPAGLLDRLAFHLDLSEIAATGADMPCGPCETNRLREIDAARALLPQVTADEAIMEALCATAQALGIASVRAPMLALRVARAAAALAGRTEILMEDAALAGRLVLARRATKLPDPEPAPPQDERAEHSEADPPDGDDDAAETDGVPEEIVLAAAQAAIPAGLLAQLRLDDGKRRLQSAGRAGQSRPSGQRGRPVGVRRGEPRGGARLNVLETLKAAAPWQRLRQGGLPGGVRLVVRRDDFRVTVFKQRSGTTTIFVVDASGSAALQRLAEAKGAVELLLADCYVRRDQVALIAFRGHSAELILPPTSSLVRARRSLAGLPGGGGTPLACGIEAAMLLSDSVSRGGRTPILALLTDGRANVARDGGAGRARAEQDALSAAARVRAAGLAALLVDISPRPQDQARQLAAEMRATYLPLPYADAAALSRAVRTTAGQAGPKRTPDRP
jgi:magnesium chelatase subunit D